MSVQILPPLFERPRKRGLSDARTEIGWRNFCLTFARAQNGGRGAWPKTDERTFRMSTTKRQTMSKMNRERELREKRAL